MQKKLTHCAFDVAGRKVSRTDHEKVSESR